MGTDAILGVAEGYAAWAPLYDGDGNPLIALEGPAVLNAVGRAAGLWVLDLGCGTGRHALAMAGAGARVVGLDATAAMLDRARRKPGVGSIAWVRGSLPGPLPFEDAAFDRVVLGLVAEHVEPIDRLMIEAARVLRPGGRCVLSALHPDRTAEGQSARFIDPSTGERRSILTFHRPTTAYLDAAAGAGLRLVEQVDLVVPATLAETLPRAARYVGKRLGWVACWARPGA